jgi:hypothetical protein
VSSPQVRRFIRLSLHNGFNGFLRALPGEPGFLSPFPALSASFIAELTPVSGRQDHTTSPSAFLRRQSVHRILPNVRDDGQRPSYRGGTREALSVICPAG